ncbi:MAG: DUF4105 domain-containing protein [Pseudobdellovibrionaceae bacterium]
MRRLSLFLSEVLRKGSQGGPFVVFVSACVFAFSSQAQTSDFSPEKIVQEIEAKKLGEAELWKLLLHAREKGGLQSEIDSRSFFVAPREDWSPEVELNAFARELIREHQEISQVAQILEENRLGCRFPARYHWLQSQLSVKLPQAQCPRLENWFQTLRGESLSLVFSSYFLNNPSSTFGHTFLRINKKAATDGQRFELLDYGVNFAANPGNANAVMYALRGLFGGFPGTFTTVPYFYKVREYNNAESRDLWEYELNVPQSGVDRMILHVWELGPQYADYWYLTENCSYFMLSLLEIADSNLKLVDLQKKYVIPVDTLKTVYESPGLVRGYKFRPSIRSEFYARVSALNERDQELVRDLGEARNLSPLDSVSDTETRRKVLDSLIDFIDFKSPIEVQKESSPAWKFKAQVLQARSQIATVTPPLNVPEPEYEKPHQSHGSRRWGFGLSQMSSDSDDVTELTLSYRFALHDLLDPIRGYPEYAQIHFFDLQAGVDEDDRWQLKKFTLFEVVSLSELGLFSKTPSWMLQVGSREVRHQDCLGCEAFSVNGGIGYSFQFLPQMQETHFVGLKVWLEHAYEKLGSADKRDSAALGPQLISRWRWSPGNVSLLEAFVRYDQDSEFKNNAELKLSHRVHFGNDRSVQFSGGTRWFEDFASLDLYFLY